MRLKLSKNELRIQESKLHQLMRYLPTLQLKKSLVQTQVATAKQDRRNLEDELARQQDAIAEYASLLSQPISVDIFPFLEIKKINTTVENIAGIEVPLFDTVTFDPITYDLFDTPAWLESVIYSLRTLGIIRGKIIIAEQRQAVLEKELREVSIRVNLFEKVLIPRCENNIKRIKVFLAVPLFDVGWASKGCKKETREKRGMTL